MYKSNSALTILNGRWLILTHTCLHEFSFWFRTYARFVLA